MNFIVLDFFLFPSGVLALSPNYVGMALANHNRAKFFCYHTSFFTTLFSELNFKLRFHTQFPFIFQKKPFTSAVSI